MMDEVKKEIGKWFLDIAKYVTTAVVLTTIFSSVSNQGIILIGGVATVSISMAVGIWLIKPEAKKQKTKNKR